MFDYTCEIIDRWQELPCNIRSGPYVEGERQFWTTIWTVQALSDKGHWADGLPQKEFPRVIKILEGKEIFPDFCNGKRP